MNAKEKLTMFAINIFGIEMQKKKKKLLKFSGVVELLHVNYKIKTKMFPTTFCMGELRKMRMQFHSFSATSRFKSNYIVCTFIHLEHTGKMLHFT